jgi:hypothetical protein
MNWFTPKCPVNDEEKDWIEDSVLWIVKAFNLNSLKDITVVLPTPEFFPDTYSGQEQHVRKLLDRVCSFVGVNPDRLELELCADEKGELRHHLPFFESSHKGAAGQYQKDADRIKIKISAPYQLREE